MSSAITTSFRMKMMNSLLFLPVEERPDFKIKHFSDMPPAAAQMSVAGYFITVVIHMGATPTSTSATVCLLLTLPSSLAWVKTC